MTIHRRAALHVYGYKNRKVRSTSSHQAVQRKKKRVQTLTPREKLAATARRRENTQRLQSALDDALQVVWQEAVKLHEKLGIRSPKAFYEMLLQKGGKNTREPSRWNIWLHKKQREKLAGKWPLLP